MGTQFSLKHLPCFSWGFPGLGVTSQKTLCLESHLRSVLRHCGGYWYLSDGALQTTGSVTQDGTSVLPSLPTRSRRREGGVSTLLVSSQGWGPLLHSWSLCCHHRVFRPFQLAVAQGVGTGGGNTLGASHGGQMQPVGRAREVTLLPAPGGQGSVLKLG